MTKPRIIMSAILVGIICFLTDLASSSQVATDECTDAKAEISRLGRKVTLDERAIRRLGFQQRAQDVEDWERLSDEAQGRLMSDVFDVLLASAQKGIKTVGSLSPPMANRAISRLRAAGINSPYLNEAIRRVAVVPGKPPKAQDIHNLLDKVGKTKDAVVLASHDANDLESRLEALSTVLGWLQTNPTLALLAADFRFTTSSLYNNATRRLSVGQIEKLTSLNEQDLRALKVLSEQLRNDIQELKEAKQRAGELSNCDRRVAAFIGTWLATSEHGSVYRIKIGQKPDGGMSQESAQVIKQAPEDEVKIDRAPSGWETSLMESQGHGTVAQWKAFDNDQTHPGLEEKWTSPTTFVSRSYYSVSPPYDGGSQFEKEVTTAWDFGTKQPTLTWTISFWNSARQFIVRFILKRESEN